MNKVTHTQGSDAWKAWRRQGIGGSDISAIVGLSPYTDHDRASVLREKVTGVERVQNGAMYRGTVLEPHARLAYQQRQLCMAPPACVEMDGCPWARVSLDGLCSNGAALSTERVEWALELKCPDWKTHDAALHAEYVPDHFRAQIQWQLLVTGLERCDFASFNPSEDFTPEDWPLLPRFRDRVAGWKARPKLDRGGYPRLIDVWLEVPTAKRPPMSRAVAPLSSIAANARPVIPPSTTAGPAEARTAVRTANRMSDAGDVMSRIDQPLLRSRSSLLLLRLQHRRPSDSQVPLFLRSVNVRVSRS